MRVRGFLPGPGFFPCRIFFECCGIFLSGPLFSRLEIFLIFFSPGIFPDTRADKPFLCDRAVSHLLFTPSSGACGIPPGPALVWLGGAIGSPDISVHYFTGSRRRTAICSGPVPEFSRSVPAGCCKTGKSGTTGHDTGPVFPPRFPVVTDPVRIVILLNRCDCSPQASIR